MPRGLIAFAPEWQLGLRGVWRRSEPFRPHPCVAVPSAQVKYSCSGFAPLAGFEATTYVRVFR
jgi:hypothetical protein